MATDESREGPPSVEIDERGIGAWLGGVLEYFIHWSDIRSIEVEVVGYGNAGAEAFWVIEGAHRTPGKPAFFAPVELVAGSDKLTAKLRSMPGFDEDAFREALSAEKRAEPGTFACWPTQ